MTRTIVCVASVLALLGAGEAPAADPPAATTFGKDIAGLPAKEGLSFASAPAVRADGANVRIDFEVAQATDVAVEIIDVKGRVVRHLAAGLLGPNAPEPLAKDSLKQSLPWDRADDAGKPVTGPAKVRVGLGMGVRMTDRTAAWSRGPLTGEKPDGLNIQAIKDLVVGPDGTVYLLAGYFYLEHIDVPTQIVAVSRDGVYQRQIYPPPAARVPADTPGLRTLKLANGQQVPRSDTMFALFSQPIAYGTKLAITPDNKRLLLVAGRSRHLYQFGLDGSMPQTTPTSLPEGWRMDRYSGLGWNRYGQSVAVSPDSRWLYVIGTTGEGKAQRRVVHRMALASGESSVFFGGGDDALTLPTSLAVTPAGSLLIADFGGNCIWTVPADGAKASSVKFAQPFAVAAGLNDSIYVVSVEADPAKATTVSKGTKLGPDAAADRGLVSRLTKLRADGEELASIAAGVKSQFGEGWPTKLTFAGLGVDRTADKPIVWIGLTTSGGVYPAGYHYGLCRIVDDGKTLGPAQYVDANGRYWQSTMKGFRDNRAAASKWSKQGRGAETLWPDGYRYTQAWARGNPPTGELRRFTADGSESPFPAMGEKKWYPLTGAPSGYGINSRFYMTPQKDLLVSYLRFQPKGKGDYNGREFSAPFEGPDKLTPDGKLQYDFIYGIMSIAAKTPYRADRRGAVYTADHTLPPGRWGPAEIEAALPGAKPHPRDPYTASYGCLYKFPPTGGGLVWDSTGEKFKAPAPVSGDLIRHPTVVSDTIGSPKWKAGCENIEWQFIGVSPVPSARVNICTCTGIVFDLDRHDRIYVPDMYRMCVHVLDTSGNLLLRVGRYGNYDDSLRDIAFARPRIVAPDGEQMCVTDTQNNLTTKLEAIYAVEKTADMPQ